MTRPVLLALSLVALAVGPLLGSAASHLRSRGAHLVLLTLVVAVCVQVFPEAWESLGVWALVFLLAGWVLPTAAERFRHSDQVHAIPRVLVAAGLAGHALLDGAAIGAPIHGALGWAVVLHRLPAATATWMVLEPAWGRRWAVGVLLTTGLATIIGFTTAAVVSPLHEAGPIAAISTLVTGSLMHLATHPLDHDHDHDHD